jgi:hypothetical protein
MGGGASTPAAADDDVERRQRPSMTEVSQAEIDDLQREGGSYTFEPYEGPRTLKGTAKHVLAGVRMANESGSKFIAGELGEGFVKMCPEDAPEGAADDHAHAQDDQIESAMAELPKDVAARAYSILERQTTDLRVGDVNKAIRRASICDRRSQRPAAEPAAEPPQLVGGGSTLAAAWNAHLVEETEDAWSAGVAQAEAEATSTPRVLDTVDEPCVSSVDSGPPNARS